MMKRTMTACAMILICAAVLALVGCGGNGQTSGATQKPDTTEVKPFSTCGFSFEYPRAFSISQEGLLDEDANENTGFVQVAPAVGQLPLFAVTWVRTWHWGLEGALDAGFAGIENWEGIESIAKGELVETTLATHGMLYESRHRMLYRPYTATDENGVVKVRGVVAALYCDQTQRAFGLVTLNEAATSAQQALLTFQDYVDSFVCH